MQANFVPQREFPFDLRNVVCASGGCERAKAKGGQTRRLTPAGRRTGSRSRTDHIMRLTE